MGAKTTEALGRDTREEFLAAGFEVAPGATESRMEVRKYSCSYVVGRGPGGGWVPEGPPRFLVRGLECELEDQGYQKFWLADGKRFPIRLQDLRALHDFDEKVRELLGLKQLYHESLGTTSARSAYDRLEGRPDR